MGKGREVRKDTRKDKILDKVKKAQAAHYDEKEKQEIITGKRVEYVHKQKGFRSTCLQLIYSKTELDEVRKQLMSNSGDNGTEISLKWMGMPYPRKLLQIKHDMMVDDYRYLLANFETQKIQLKTYNLTEEQLNEIMEKGKLFDKLPEEKIPKSD